MQPEDGVAFGTVSRSDSQAPIQQLRGIPPLDVLREKLAPAVAANPNLFYMLKVRGNFRTMHVRSCFVCEKPYPTLSEAAGQQREFRCGNVSGSIIAVFCPAYVEGINLPGWHFHFLSGDKQKGGHILGLSADTLEYQINALHDFELLLPQNSEFAGLDLCENLSAKTAAVEG